MEYLPDVFSADDAECEVVNAFSFEFPHLYVAISARSEEEGLSAGGLLRIDASGPDPTYELLHEFDSGLLDYHAQSSNVHYALESGSYLHVFSNGDHEFFQFPAPEFLNHVTPMAPGRVAVYGEGGTIYRFEGGLFTPIPAGSPAALNAMHFPRPDFGYACGRRGTLLESDGNRFVPSDIGGAEPLQAVHVRESGGLMLGSAGGVGIVVDAGEVLRLEGTGSDLLSVTEFGGQELWGDDDFGVYTRRGSELVPRFGTGGAFNMNPIGNVLTINAGYEIYATNGADWIRIGINPDVDDLVERLALDFTPL